MLRFYLSYDTNIILKLCFMARKRKEFAIICDNLYFVACEQQKNRTACKSAQFDQCLCYSLSATCYKHCINILP